MFIQSDLRLDFSSGDFGILLLCLISGFCHEVDEKCALLGYYTASSGNFLLMFQHNMSVPSSCWQEITTTRCVITKKSTVLILFLCCTRRSKSDQKSLTVGVIFLHRMFL